MLLSLAILGAAWSPVHFAGAPRHRRAPPAACSEADGRPVAIVTGGSGGIGLAVSRRLAAEGHDLVLGYGRDDARAKAACESLEAEHGVSAVCVRGDLTNDADRALA